MRWERKSKKNLYYFKKENGDLLDTCSSQRERGKIKERKRRKRGGESNPSISKPGWAFSIDTGVASKPEGKKRK